jgi:hypothetical protein
MIMGIRRAHRSTFLYPQKLAQVAVDQSVYFACGLKATKFFFCLFVHPSTIVKSHLLTKADCDILSSVRNLGILSNHHPVKETISCILMPNAH